MKDLFLLSLLVKETNHQLSTTPIIFGRDRAQAPIPRASDDDLEPSQFFHYARSAHHMMKRMGYSLKCGDGLNFSKGRRVPLQPFVPEGKPPNYYDRGCRGLGYVTPPLQSETESDKSPPSQSSDSSSWDSNCSMGGNLQKATCQHDIYSQTEQDEDIEPFDADSWA